MLVTAAPLMVPGLLSGCYAQERITLFNPPGSMTLDSVFVLADSNPGQKNIKKEITSCGIIFWRVS